MIHMTDIINFKLLKTGQTTQYGGYLDDGFYEMGAAKEYTIHTLFQYAGTTNIVLNAKTDVHSNNCVYDKRTQLMWSRYVSGSVGPGSDGKLPWTTNGNGEGIFAFVAAANLAKLAGYSDWRIPNDLELASLRVMEKPTAAPDTIAFPNWPIHPSLPIWCSNTVPDTLTYGVRVTFSTGALSYSAKTTDYYCPLVRGN